MELVDDVGELKNVVSRAFSAALFSIDFHIIQKIIRASEEAKRSFGHKNYNQVQYIINKCFWDIGVCIKEKIKTT